MTLEDLITHLMILMRAHGNNARVLVNHSDMAEPVFIPAEDGCPAYISLESEL